MRTIDDIKVILFDEKDRDNEIIKRVLSLNGKELLGYGDTGRLAELTAAVKSRGYDSKEVLILTPFRGRFFQLCPGSPGMICCRYRVLNTCFNCLYDCTYCYLNSYLNSFGIIQFTNFDEALREIDDFRLGPEGDMVYRVGTGEFTDSLMMDEVTGIGRKLIEHAAEMNNVMVELKTKSPNIGHLLDIKDKGNAVLAWSMNTERNIHRYEKDASSLEERLFAAKRAAKSGYFVAFHFDPVILYPGWRDDYRKLIKRIFQEIDQARTVWISLGCFRYSPSFKEIIRGRFPEEDLTAHEMFPGRDGKMRYLRSRRRDVYLSLISAIREHASLPFIYLCMESADMWEETLGAAYAVSEDLERSMSSYLRQTFLEKNIRQPRPKKD